MTIEEFISTHQDDDLATLALRAPRDAGFDVGFAIDQIAGRRKARSKLPSWAERDGITYPPRLAMEQCSSEPTALYKAALVRRLLDGLPQEGPTTLCDLTGGFGVDFSFMAPEFGRAVYVERQTQLCDIARRNLEALGVTNATVVNAESEDYLRRMDRSTVIYMDPARRDCHGGRTFAIADCSPDALALSGELERKSCFTVIKLSPMLDWRKAVADFDGLVAEVHAVSSANECKELLLVLSPKRGGLERIYCVNDDTTLSYTPAEADEAERADGRFVPDEELLAYSLSATTPTAPLYLYEPNASVMKTGCFALLARRHGAKELSRDSHLTLSERPLASFPGRGFAIRTVTSMNKKELKAALGDTRKANLTVRNFPSSVAELRKKLRLAEGGDTYIFATTTQKGRRVLVVCDKLSDTRQ